MESDQTRKTGRLSDRPVKEAPPNAQRQGSDTKRLSVIKKGNDPSGTMADWIIDEAEEPPDPSA
jgi:hypothetical protein